MKKRLLIADDEQGIRDLFCFLLESQGFEVFTVGDGLAAVEMVQKQMFDLVFLDIHMPKLKGPEALKRIKGIYPDLTVVIFSSSCDPEFIYETEAKQNGAFDCLYKPFNIDDLMAVIARALHENEVV
ncbi:MAG TPA: response regulator [Bacillota bacterium]|nr:response regulator [Bacillota bacterium]